MLHNMYSGAQGFDSRWCHWKLSLT